MCACLPSSGDAEYIHEYTGRTSLTTGVGRPEHGKRWKQVTNSTRLQSVNYTRIMVCACCYTYDTHMTHTQALLHTNTHRDTHIHTNNSHIWKKSVDGHISSFASLMRPSIGTAEKKRTLSWLKVMVGKAEHISSFLGRRCTRPHLLT